MGAADLETRIRAICLALPEVAEKRSHGTPAFFVRKQFLMLWLDGHHETRWPQLWCAAAPGAQAALVEAEPARYFRPPYVGSRGWLGVRLDDPLADDELRDICEDAYRAVAPPKLLARLHASANEAGTGQPPSAANEVGTGPPHDAANDAGTGPPPSAATGVGTGRPHDSAIDRSVEPPDAVAPSGAQPSGPVTLDDVARLASALPEVTEGHRYGQRTWFVAKKGFAWERPFSKADLERFGTTVPPAGPILAVRVADLGDKEAVLAAHRGPFFTIPHFDRYPAVLIRLDAVDRAALQETIMDAWLACAPPRLSRRYLEG